MNTSLGIREQIEERMAVADAEFVRRLRVDECIEPCREALR